MHKAMVHRLFLLHHCYFPFSSQLLHYLFQQTGFSHSSFNRFINFPHTWNSTMVIQFMGADRILIYPGQPTADRRIKYKSKSKMFRLGLPHKQKM